MPRGLWPLYWFSDENPPIRTNCWACNTELSPGQRYCKECNHFQNWRRHFNFSTAVLSLLVAILSLSVPIIDRLSALYHPFEAVANLAFTSYENAAVANEFDVTVTIVNESEKPIFLTDRGSCFTGRSLKKGESVGNLSHGYLNMYFHNIDESIVNSHKAYHATIDPASFTFGNHLDFFFDPSKNLSTTILDEISSDQELRFETKCTLDVLHNGHSETLKLSTNATFTYALLRRLHGWTIDNPDSVKRRALQARSSAPPQQ